MHTETKRWIPQARSDNPAGGFYLPITPPPRRPKSAIARPVARKAAFVRPDSQRIRNFAAVARLLALARRRKADPWHLAFRAGATHNALQELNASGEISRTQYSILDSWIFWGAPPERAVKKAPKLYSASAVAGHIWKRPKRGDPAFWKKKA